MNRLVTLGLTSLLLLVQQAGAQQDEKAQINSYIKKLKYDPRIVLAVQGEGKTSLTKGGEKDKGENVDDSDPKKLVIVTTKQHSLSRNFEEVSILQPTRGIIFPGSLVKANDALVNGRPTRISAFEGKGARAKLSISLPGLGKMGEVDIENPTDSAVRAAIDERVTWWLDNKDKEGFKHTSVQSYDMTMAYSNEQVALSLGLTASSVQGAVSAEMKVDSSSDKKVVIAIYKQLFYTVSCNAPTNPVDFMAETSKLEDVKDVMTATEPPAYVQSVNFGRIIMLRVETSKSTTEGELNGMLKYAKGDNKLDIDSKNKYKKILESSKISVITLGGNSKLASTIITAKDPEALADVIQKNSEFAKDNPGEPISYNVFFLKDNVLAKMGYTTDYSTSESKEYSQGLVKFKNSGAYVARFYLDWEEYVNKGGKWQWEKKSDTWKTPAANFKTYELKPGVRNVKAVGKAYTGIGEASLREIFSENFDGAPRVQIEVTGSTLVRRYNKKSID